jgi:regulator of sirC expression with transglutaminase-like and TPR domain
MEFSLAHQHLLALTRQPDYSLAEAALYIAQAEYPTLSVSDSLAQLDQIADHLRPQIPDPPYPLKVLRTINRYLFEELGFQGNQAEYYDPRNSFFNQVLERRLGIPITLSLLYLEVAERLGIPMVGINFPGHFLIRLRQPNLEFLVDPFAGGEILFIQDCQARLAQLLGESVALQPQYFAEISPQGFLLRLLGNLEHIYLHHQDLSRCITVCEQMLLIAPDAHPARRDRGLFYYQSGRWTEAISDLQEYLPHTTSFQEAQMITQLLSEMEPT